ncbi:DHA2 family efflux MFS transporter permease subunit [Jatrophihabitans cynanchi]|jgi:EmrB/QacA subfamily drug resistance transporter|uniref:DHA2 family efflux MFS transporter permease subunit n=1 Tax=Jatrophihabitans cynanchi TaxID=2944128 RepID=A0ABY7JW92_9ACTN|nr:DHA2 family efflux MFS transporter permease subunit [Jatrophihabitans sp. SB3-54]WAX56828.1 DHA2 family efflux MFS transporter permease subunit [Jatrophihabitans sp. SB3-54]
MSAPSAAAQDTKLDGAVLKVAGVVVLGAIMSILDITVVSVALPTFQDVFHTSYANVAWTMTGYTLALATVIPLSGWAADRFGTKRLYMTALLLFVLGSALCSTATGIGMLITFRVLQGLGGGMLMPVGMTIMTRAAGPERVGRVMAVLGVPMLLGPIGGPILGGWLIGVASWHWIFLINVPIGAAALIYAQLVLPKDNPSPSESFDFLGMLLLSPGLALFLFGVSSIPEEGTVAAARVIVPAIVGGLLIVAFILHAFRPEHPLIDLRLFKNRQLSLSIIAMWMFAVAFFGAALLLPSYFLQVRGESTLHAGLLVAPQGIGAMITMPIAGTLADRIAIKKVVAPGLLLIIAGMSMLTQIDAHTHYAVLIGTLFVMGLGMGCTMMPLFTGALRTLSGPTIARGSTLMNITQQIASSVGTATMSVILTNQIRDSKFAAAAIGSWADPSIKDKVPAGAIAKGLSDAGHGFAVTFTVALVLIVITLIPVLLLPGRRPASSETGAGEAAAEVPVALH